MTEVNPIKYKIHLEPDLKNFKFAGSTEILLDAVRPVSEIILNILELAIWNCKIRVGALNGDDKGFDWFETRFNTSESEHDRMNILVALGCFREKKLIQRAQQYILGSVPGRNKFIPIASMTVNPNAVPHMWDWFRSQLNALEQFHPLHYERVIAGIIPVCGLGREDEVTAFFKDYMHKKSKARDAIKLSLEKLEINSRMRNA